MVINEDEERGTPCAKVTARLPCRIFVVYAFAEPLAPGSMVLRAGPETISYGDPYHHAVAMEPAGTTAVLKGFVVEQGKLTADHIDAIMRCLGPCGFDTLFWERIEPGKPPRPITLPIKEMYMSIDSAHEHAQKALAKAIEHADKAGLTDFSNALKALGAAADAGIPAAKGSDLAAQGEAVRNIFAALQAVQVAGLACDKSHAIHHDVVNVLNAIENVSMQVHAANKARLHQALN